MNTEDMNRRLSSLLCQIDDQAISCANTPSLPNVYYYFSLLDQVYLNTNYLYSAKLRMHINQLKEKFYTIYNTILQRNYDENQEVGVTPMESLLMISYLKKINNAIIIGLQKHGYFFAQETVDVDESANFDYYDMADHYSKNTKKEDDSENVKKADD